jgi:hypothetical protein
VGGLIYCTLWRRCDADTPIYLLVLLLSVWNLLFSPFSGTHRILISFSCGLLLMLWRECWGKDERATETTSLSNHPQLSPAHSS